MRKRFISLLTIVLCSLYSVAIWAQSAPLNGLLEDVKNIATADSAVNREREARFTAGLSQWQEKLAGSQRRLQQADEQKAALKQAFDNNEHLLAEQEQRLSRRSGQLGEVFGVAREVAQQLESILSDSLTSADNPDRARELAFADSKAVPTLQQLNALWYQLQAEMTAQGEIKQFDTAVITPGGETVQTQVLRIGDFTAMTQDGQFLNWQPELQRLAVLAAQPDDSHQQEVSNYLSGEGSALLIDPTRGQLLSLLSRTPDLGERLEQGGEVGYLIMGLGLLGLIIAALQMVRLTLIEYQVKRQLALPDELNQQNPLGRVLIELTEKALPLPAMELKLDEVILRELPGLERGQSFVKLLAGVAPLLGLLGTVVGMIATFQSITLFGTSDPQLMAGGISQALMTTVLGLIVAIPLLFCHSYLAAKSRRIVLILQEKSLAVLVESGSINESDDGQVVHAA
jgi:biopolymer transport protein ExbB